ncbi:hypothetical protein WA026_010590 [Henosepilachna vigintioctopunctata]|uniref:VWFA domain-containing protein n=1 Tax=Henosepilachna vigintioctopunctata TaxID=420089 RepID=A0AAW1VBM6_9CUCU
MPKQVVFVLDISGSMYGRKVQQLINAMVRILDDLQPNDSFSIVAFDTTVNVWNKGSGWIDLNLGYNSAYGELEKILMQKEIPPSIPATTENIAEAKSFVKTIGPRSLTNIFGGLEVGLFIVKKAQQNSSEYHQPLMVFLTDGQANVGISGSDAIRKSIAKLNPKDKQTPIFSLSFGTGADKDFLRKLSDDNLGFSRHIFDASDASLQLQDFYQLISSPIMKDVSFRYTKDATVTTKHDFPIFFRGSEFVVAGKIPKDPKNEYLIEGWRPGGLIKMKPKIVEPVQSLERMWAFLTVQQILEKRKVVDDKSELTKKAVDLALKYSFVTPVTSLVVVKPNATDAVNTENAYKIYTSRGVGNAGQFHHYLPSRPSNIIPFRLDSLGNVGQFHNSFPLHSMNTYQSRVGNYIPHKRTPSRKKSVKSHRDGSKHINSYKKTSYSIKRHRPIYRHSITLPVPHFSGNRHRLMYSFPPPDRPLYNGFAKPMQTFALPTSKLEKLEDSVFAPPPNSSLPVDLPELRKQDWFKSISNKYAIRIPKAETYRLATNETVVAKQPCARTVLHKPGNCTLIHQCPSAFKFLTDLPTFLRFFCPIEKYAGICCDV